jgi:predicted nuclease of restriction endonuclease-like (RecB) superfamily
MELQSTYQSLLDQIKQTYSKGKTSAIKAAGREMLLTYWAVGRHIVEYEQSGNEKAEYGSKILERLSKDLSDQLGRGFSRTNLISMRLCYLKYPSVVLLSDQLTWGHYVELMNIDHDLERSFYEKQTIIEKWTVRELKRQKNSALFLRLAASQDKASILQLAEKGKMVKRPEDLLRDPYVFEFLKIPEPYHLSEKELEDRLLDNLQSFLLELGKGFTFVGRQYGITIDNERYRVDLVFYHRFLRCFVLLELKIEKVKHHDIGQMNMYLGYFAKEEYFEGDNPPVGILLTRHKDELLVEFATYGMNSQLFVSKYQLYLPNEAELRAELEYIFTREENKGE